MLRRLLNRRQEDLQQQQQAPWKKARNTASACNTLGQTLRESWRPRSITWWAARLLKASDSFQTALDRQLFRKLQIDSGCTGIGSCLASIEGLGLPCESVDCCDRNEAVPLFLMANYSSILGCIYDSLASHANLCGKCAIHEYTCMNSRRRCRKDLLILGPPCQPYSSLSNATDPLQHEDFEIIFGYRHSSLGRSRVSDNVIDFVAHTKPAGVLFENVAAFETSMIIHEGVTVAHAFISDMMALEDHCGVPLFSAYHVFRVQPRFLLPMDRTRL